MYLELVLRLISTLVRSVFTLKHTVIKRWIFTLISTQAQEENPGTRAFHKYFAPKERLCTHTSVIVLSFVQWFFHEEQHPAL